jgi:hypothetical protein
MVHSSLPTLAFNAPAINGLGTPGSGKRTKAAIAQKLSVAIAEDIGAMRMNKRQTYQKVAGSIDRRPEES